MTKTSLPKDSDNNKPAKAAPPHRIAEAVETDAAPDPFNAASLRLNGDFASNIGVNKIITEVPCRKPNRHEFVRTRPGDEWRLETAAFEDKTCRETYLVDRSLWSDLAGEVYPVCLFLAINRQGDLFLWPVKLDTPETRSQRWNSSALTAARTAEDQWVRVVANMGAGYYDLHGAVGELTDPEWPDLSFDEALRLSFRDRFIEDRDHPVMKALRGEI